MNSSAAMKSTPPETPDLESLQKRILELESLNEELSEFVHLVAHDLKSPLRGITTLAEIIREEAIDRFDPQSLSHFVMIEKRASRMQEMITGILSYCVADKKMTTEMVCVRSLVSEIIEYMHLPEHVEVQLFDAEPKVKASRIRLQQVFQNLISNAVKYNDKSKCEITVDYRATVSGHLFSIVDNGMGIDPRYTEKIFDMFETIEPKDISQSSGIGLAVVRKIVRSFGGKIWADSEPQKGSSFNFTIPG